MKARFLHYIQIVPLFFWILSLSDLKPYLEWAAFGYEKILLALLAIFSLITPVLRRTYKKSVFSSLALSALFFLALNKLIEKPTLGIFLICAYMITLYFSLNKEDSKYFKAPIFNTIISFLVPLGLFTVIKSGNYVDWGLYYYATALSLVSAFLVTSQNISSLTKIRGPLTWVGLILSSGTFYLDNTGYQIFLILFFIVVDLVFLALSLVKRETLVVFESFYRKILSTPELAIIFYFMIVALLGGVFLQLPLAQADLSKHHFIDTLFTAISAVCVTGLTVLDTALDFTFWGQLFILILIQLGGLGIVSITTWALVLLRKSRVSIAEEATVSNLSGYQSDLSPQQIMRRILTYFAVTEVMGAFLLSICFYSVGDSLFHSIWRGVFTSISAFCNAGFSVQSTSLVDYQSQPAVLLIVSFLIIAGGFSPLFAFLFPKKLKTKSLTLNEKIVISTTAGLLILGFIFFLFVEWNSSLAGLSFNHKVVNAWFQSATTRTAGFNSLDYSSLQDITSYFMLMLMFVGGNAGSTAGGVKTIIFAIIIITAFNALKGRSETLVFKRRIPAKTVYKALSIFSLALVVNFFIFFALSMTQNIDSLQLFFESFSALATVGLSLGATPLLDEVGKVIIMIAMFVGRIGPITFMLLMSKGESQKYWKYPEEEVFIS